MSGMVLDSSVLIAILKQEPGWESAEACLNQGVVSAVNMAEVATFISRSTPSMATIRKVISSFMVEIAAFDISQVAQTGFLNVPGAPLGLSLGDRACLALAVERNLPVMTTDRIWKQLQDTLGVNIVLIR